MIFFKKAARIKELEDQLFDMEHRAVEAEALLDIASEKLATWVKKHDNLLIYCKEHHGKSISAEGSTQAQ